MHIDEFLDLARNRRSIRKFKPDPIPDEYIQNILEAARWAMSGANGQPWEFIVVKEPLTKQKMAAAYLHYHTTQIAAEMTRLPEYRHGTATNKDRATTPWQEAPVIIAVLGDMRTMMISTLIQRMYEQHTFDHNMANTVQMMHLAIAALGLGSQWLSIDPPRNEAIKQILGIPPELRLFALVPLGFPAQQKIGKRRELRELVHYEKFDPSKLRTLEDILEFIMSERRQHS
jgi:nitroreductase